MREKQHLFCIPEGIFTDFNPDSLTIQQCCLQRVKSADLSSCSSFQHISACGYRYHIS